MSLTFDPIWEELYSGGHGGRYPWDCVVSFYFQNRGLFGDSPRVLEVGCGTAANLWFAAREGATVAGIDGSESAIAIAKKRFAEDGLSGDLRVGDFTELPFDNAGFDMAIDRGALICCGRSGAQKAIDELHRVLQPGGRFFYNAYSKEHTSYLTSSEDEDGLCFDVQKGTLVNVGHLCFYNRAEVLACLGEGWKIVSMRHLQWAEEVAEDVGVHAEWRVVAERI